VFPAGILQSPTFFPYGDDPNYLNFLNLGGFGTVAGHEISHGFDQNGRHYDENGTLTDWWTKTTVRGFEKREGCFIDQYGAFTIKVPILSFMSPNVGSQRHRCPFEWEVDRG